MKNLVGLLQRLLWWIGVFLFSIMTFLRLVFIIEIVAIPGIDWVGVLAGGAIITSVPIGLGILCVKFGKNE